MKFLIDPIPALFRSVLLRSLRLVYLVNVLIFLWHFPDITDVEQHWDYIWITQLAFRLSSNLRVIPDDSLLCRQTLHGPISFVCLPSCPCRRNVAGACSCNGLVVTSMPDQSVTFNLFLFSGTCDVIGVVQSIQFWGQVPPDACVVICCCSPYDPVND